MLVSRRAALCQVFCWWHHRAQASSDTVHLTSTAANDPSDACRAAAQRRQPRASEAAATSGTVPGQYRVFLGDRTTFWGLRMRYPLGECWITPKLWAGLGMDVVSASYSRMRFDEWWWIWICDPKKVKEGFWKLCWGYPTGTEGYPTGDSKSCGD